MINYKLVGKKPVICGPDDKAWTANRHVRYTHFLDLRISTVFVPIDQGFEEGKPPLVFETMVFPLNTHRDLYCRRYYTWNAAVLGHYKTLFWVVLYKMGLVK